MSRDEVEAGRAAQMMLCSYFTFLAMCLVSFCLLLEP